ncbi:sn1-specific diacylglycerol lipase alpha isoform X2 [Photinus pyralis]|uniref:sn1-specific diacylglycerol lipase alpha isoform X2 n=1 Tax=Photinus pyralis TaxID=7054 RepID=UPI0012677591|nr:sn1-specific diacylglycerol lipase alpha isoform X2 [Photinus pyralis]
MPGLTAFNRRWSVGSDDFVLPGAILSLFHLICALILTGVLCLTDFKNSDHCVLELWIFNIVYLSIVLLCLMLEFYMSCVSYKGSILNTEPRSAVKYILYVRLLILNGEMVVLGYGIYWTAVNYHTCPVNYAKTVFLVLITLNWFTIICILVNIWCAYDPAGRSWVKMKAYQRSMRESESKYQYKRSGSTRNWRQRKVMKAYQDSWDQRCRLLFCCMRATDTNRNSFREIARLLSDYFRDLDVVPSDVVAGIILLRIYQKIERRAIIERRKNDTYEFLSGVPVTSSTKFLSLQEGGADLELFQTVIRYVHFAVRAYGWPMFVMTNKMGLCHICSNASCCFPNVRNGVEVVEDNCCNFNRAALQTLSEFGNIEIIYATYHVDIGKTPFFIALDYDREKIVISIRGTLSMNDILTDLNAEAERIPVEPLHDDFLGHKGMVSAAVYILEKIRLEKLLERAHNYRTFLGTKDYDLVIVGHSLGAGIASILGIMLRREYPNLSCYCYSPPGGLLSMAAMEYTKSFTTAVVLGKDVVPRLGLNQMEALRADLINAIKRSVDPKWKIISCGVMCCCCAIEPTSATELSTADQVMADYIQEKQQTRTTGGVHPSDSTIALTRHPPMYPPGRVIHIVRHHPTKDEKALSGNDPVYQAIWAENTDFDEVLISPVMIQDHMPDTLLTALNKVVINMGPRKPRRLNLNDVWNEYKTQQEVAERQNVCLETCFTAFPETAVFPPKVEPIKRLVHKVEIARKMLAPLAQPEYFSDTSSLTSNNSNLEPAPENPTIADSPQVILAMRRTPKIIGNLSTCDDDIRNVKTFEKLAKASHTDKSNSSSNVSSTSGFSGRTNCSNEHEHFVSLGSCSWQRSCDSEQVKSTSLAEDLLEEILEYAECAEFFKSDSLLTDYGDQLVDGDTTLKLPTLRFSETSHSPLILSPSSLDIDPDVISNYAIDLNLEQEHRSLLSYQNLHSSILKVQGNSCNGSNSPLCSKTVTFNPEVLSIDDKVEQAETGKERFRLWTYIQSHFAKRSKHSSAEVSSNNVSTISSRSDKCSVEPLLDTFKSDSEYT